MTVLGVVGSSGGVGASSLVCALGVVAARRGSRVAIVDVDEAGGGLQVTAGVEHEPGVRWADLAEAEGVLDGDRLLAGLPSVEGCAVLSAGTRLGHPAGAVPERLDARVLASAVHALDGACELVVLDLPRSGRSHLVPEGSLIVVAGLTPRGVADATALAARYDRHDLAGLVTRGSRRDGHIAEAVAEHLGLALLGNVPSDRSVLSGALRGQPPGIKRRRPLGRLAESLVAAATQGTLREESSSTHSPNAAGPRGRQ